MSSVRALSGRLVFVLREQVPCLLAYLDELRIGKIPVYSIPRAEEATLLSEIVEKQALLVKLFKHGLSSFDVVIDLHPTVSPLLSLDLFNGSARTVAEHLETGEALLESVLVGYFDLDIAELMRHGVLLLLGVGSSIMTHVSFPSHSGGLHR